MDWNNKCACLRVEYMPTASLSNKGLIEKWVCIACGAEFQRKPKPDFMKPKPSTTCKWCELPISEIIDRAMREHVEREEAILVEAHRRCCIALNRVICCRYETKSVTTLKQSDPVTYYFGGIKAITLEPMQYPEFDRCQTEFRARIFRQYRFHVSESGEICK
jgi:hypothetical protein